MKLRKWFWGLFFLAAGFIIVINQLGYFQSINLLTLFFTILLIPIILKSITHLYFSGILFPLAFLGILYAKPLGIEALTPWPILLTALFLSIGLAILFPKSKHHLWSNKSGDAHFDTITDVVDNSTVNVSVSFGSSIKYVNSNDFKKGNFRCSFGALKVYFDNTIVSAEGADIYLDVSFAGVELFIPKEWNVKSSIEASFGGVDEKNKSNGTGPTVTLHGSVSLAGIEIIYI